MGNLPEHIRSKGIRYLNIPGAHDAFTANLNVLPVDVFDLVSSYTGIISQNGLTASFLFSKVFGIIEWVDDIIDDLDIFNLDIFNLGTDLNECYNWAITNGWYGPPKIDCLVPQGVEIIVDHIIPLLGIFINKLAKTQTLSIQDRALYLKF